MVLNQWAVSDYKQKLLIHNSDATALAQILDNPTSDT